MDELHRPCALARGDQRVILVAAGIQTNPAYIAFLLLMVGLLLLLRPRVVREEIRYLDLLIGRGVLFGFLLFLLAGHDVHDLDPEADSSQLHDVVELQLVLLIQSLQTTTDLSNYIAAMLLLDVSDDQPGMILRIKLLSLPGLEVQIDLDAGPEPVDAAVEHELRQVAAEAGLLIQFNDLCESEN